MSSPAPVAQPSFLQRAKKAVVAGAGGLALVASTGVFEESEELWINAAIAIATALGVYKARNVQSVAERNIWH